MAQDLQARLINPADTGGLPIFNDDIAQAQDNNRNTSIEYFEFLRSNINNHTGKLDFPTGPGAPTTEDVGLIISGCVTDKSGLGPYPVSEGYVYISGEVMKFPGATIAANEFIQMKKGAQTITQRTFKDGITKNAVEEYTLDFDISLVGIYGPVLTAGYLGTQVIMIYEDFTELHTILGAQSLLTQQNPGNYNGLLYTYDNPTLTGATLEAYTTGTIKSRVKELYTNEVVINATVETSTFVDATKEYVIATLVGWIADAEINTVAYLRGTTPDLDVTALIRVLVNGQVILRQPLGNTTWLQVAGSSIYTINVSSSIISEVSRPYNGYNTSFMTTS